MSRFKILYKILEEAYWVSWPGFCTQYWRKHTVFHVNRWHRDKSLIIYADFLISCRHPMNPVGLSRLDMHVLSRVPSKASISWWSVSGHTLFTLCFAYLLFTFMVSAPLLADLDSR